MPFSATLQKFDNCLRTNLPESYKILLDPASYSEIDEFCIKHNIESEEFRLLYSWKNGVDVYHTNTCDDDVTALFGHMLSLASISRAMASIELVDKWKDVPGKFIPLFREYDPISILFSNFRDNNYGKIFIYSEPNLIFEPITIFDSMESMLLTHIEFFERKVINYNSKSGRNIDVFSAFRIGREMNPNSEYFFR